MKSKILWALVGLNAVLLFTFITQIGRPSNAVAQFRRPPDYIIIPGEIVGGPTEVIYIIDTTNGILGGMAYDDGLKKLSSMAPINLDAVYDAALRAKGK